MTSRKQERLAKNLISTFLDVWCSVDERDEDSTSNNCHHCEFEDGGKCLAKVFLYDVKYPDEFPHGHIVGRE